MATELKSATQTGQTETRDVDEFASLLKQSFKPRSERAASEVENAVSTLVQQALADQSLVKDDVLDTIEEMIAQLDKKLSEQVNAIIHAPEFQQIESAWRGLNYLIMNSETDVQLKIRVMNVSKNELSRTLKLYPGAKWDQSPLFKKVYEQEFGQLGGEPYGCLIGDYYFSHLPQDVQLMRDLSKVAASAHAPFFAAAGPTLMGMDSWNELANPRDLGKIFDTPDYAAWRSLRDSDDSCYMGLCMPRVLSRLPYGAKSDPVEEFGFEEETDGHTGSNYAWMNASYAMAVNINRAFKEWGWCTRIRGVQSGGEVVNLPTHTFPSDDGGVDLKCPTEIAISDRREAELSKNGLLPLLHRKNTDLGVFIGAQTVNKPIKYEDPDASANAELSARLPYIFATCRFAHYLKCMVRDKIGTFKERHEVEEWLNQWIQGYVHPSPELGSEESKAQQPLSSAEVKVEEVADNPGYYTARFYLRPHYQLEGLTISLRLVSRLPSARKA
jgi:type VI secretion system protein ImpC